MKRSSLITAGYLLLVFLSGALVGIFGQRLYTSKAVSASAVSRSPEEYRRKYMDEMTSRLKLTPDQTARLSQVLDQTRARYREIRERSRPEMKAIHQRHVESVKAVLTPEQIPEYDRMLAEREERRKKRGSNH
ncbi:MAG: hypothetical protein FJW37_03050 [Acidobacteria bacterium]|nr:hypothetical protein [Acidobacteriota bacterium]